MLKGMRHTPCEAKYINEESLYLARDKDDIWRVGGFIRSGNYCEFESKTDNAWGGSVRMILGDIRELYQMVMPRGFERDPQGFAKIKIKKPNRKKNRKTVKFSKDRLLDLDME